MIDAGAVEAAVRDCLYRDEEVADPQIPPEGTVLVEGIVSTFGFHPDRLESHREEVTDWLAQLPHGFRRSEGGGWSFLNACMTADDELWTGMHSTVEGLLCLGIGLGLAKWAMPRELWPALPGGVPYVVVEM